VISRSSVDDREVSLMQRSIELLETLTQCDGVPGFEDEVRAVFRRELEAAGEIETDRTGSVVCRKAGGADRPHVMLDCHLDEIGFIIQHITKEGFLKFLPLGGWWNHILPAQRVRVQAGEERIVGVIGSTPPHFLPEDRRKAVLETKDMFIDIGATSGEEAESWGVRVGSWAVPLSPFQKLRGGKLYLAKAFDNRVGCALCIEAMEQTGDHPNTLFASGSAQEEVGLRGAVTAASIVDPDVAIVLECPPADDTPGFKREESQGSLGGGVQIRAYDPTMIANPRLVELAIQTARDAEIPHQITVRKAGGTDAGRIHLHERGVPSVVFGVPARYIHAHTSVIHIDDYQAALQLTLAMVKRLDEATVASF
jgi:endoglucanase